MHLSRTYVDIFSRFYYFGAYSTFQTATFCFNAESIVLKFTCYSPISLGLSNLQCARLLTQEGKPCGAQSQNQCQRKVTEEHLMNELRILTGYLLSFRWTNDFVR